MAKGLPLTFLTLTSNAHAYVPPWLLLHLMHALVRVTKARCSLLCVQNGFINTANSISVVQPRQNQLQF